MDFSQSYLKEIVSHFALEDEFLEATYWDVGHINDTFFVRLDSSGVGSRVVLQRINDRVFTNVPVLMDNFRRVTEHIRTKLELRGADQRRGTPAIHPTVDGQSYYRSHDGHYWRSLLYIEGSYYVEVAEHDGQTREAAKAFADFQRMLVDLPGERLHETIPLFHHTPTRFEQFTAALASDPLGRSRYCQEEIRFVLDRQHMIGRVTDGLACGEIPERITHNDTKINNVLFDEGTNKAVCVIDLDTVMPGSVLYDFGDMVRTSAGDFAESETDLTRVRLLPSRFEALTRGYAETADFLVPGERKNLAFSGRLITFEIGIRFLTDYLLGDTYFRIHYPEENLVRARAQLRFVREMEDHASAMEGIVDRYAG